MSKTTRRASIALLAITGAALATSIGCSGQRNRLAEFRSDPTPELVTMYQRPDDVRNMTALIKDESKRMLYRDWIYLWQMDRPTRLRPVPSAW